MDAIHALDEGHAAFGIITVNHDFIDNDGGIIVSTHGVASKLAGAIEQIGDSGYTKRAKQGEFQRSGHIPGKIQIRC